MTQSNNNSTAITPTTSGKATEFAPNSAVTAINGVGTGTTTTLLNNNVTPLNGDYALAQTLSTPPTAPAPATGGSTLFNTVIASAAAQNTFLPANGVLSAGATGEFNPSAAARATAGNYFNAASWTSTPKLAGNASAFTLTNTADGGKTVTLAENISGSPFTNGNGAVTESLVFTGNNSDTLAIRHAVTVANVPATTNITGTAGSSVDVRNENYVETYVKAGVSSNYSTAQNHKYTEVNGSQALNDTFVENYSYKDAGLTITSAVKTTLADGFNYANGSEQIAENNAANYHYAGTAGTVDYVVTDTRSLAQSDQRTFTNITTTNVAQYKVVDKQTATNPLTIDAKGVVVGTTTNLAPTTFKATNASFIVANNNYSLDVKDASGTAANVFDTLLGLGNNGTLFNSPLGSNAPRAANVYTDAAGTTLTGTTFADAITIKDAVTSAAGVVPATYFGGTVNAGNGNDTITGSKGDDTINGGAGDDSIAGGLGVNSLTGGAGADTFVVTGTDTITDFVFGTDALTVTKGTASATFVVSTGAGATTYKVAANATADTVIPATAATEADVLKIVGVSKDAPLTTIGSATASTAQTLDATLPANVAVKTILGGTAVDTIKVNNLGDTITGNGGADKITLGAGADVLKYTSATASALKTEAGDAVTSFGATDKIQFSVAFANAALKGTTFTAASNLTAVDFVKVVAGTAITAGANGSGGRFILNGTTLSFDEKGDTTKVAAGTTVAGAADDFVVLTGVPATLALTNFDFV